MLVLWLCGAVGCVEDQEGCLDLAATNFDVEADIECAEPCCEFPELVLTVRHRIVSADWPDSVQRFRYATPYLLGTGNDSISFDGFRFYLQNFVLKLTNGTEMQVADQLEIFSPTEGALTITDDVVRIDQAAFGARPLGSFLPGSGVAGLRFEVGLPAAWGQVAPTDYPQGHPLRVGQSEPTYDTLDGYSSLAAAWRIPPSAPDSTVVRFLGALPVALVLPEPVALRPGFDVNLEVRLRYDRLFAQVNLASATTGTLTGAIVDQLPNSFEFLGVTQE